LDGVAFTEYASGFVDKSSGLAAAAFVDRVDEIIQGLQEDGTLKNLSMKWFKTDYASPAADFDLDTLDQDVQ
jgi:ABC-type amino acid transport substrate-binding protein